jgi:peptidyl-prolyl cis-trans isomerase C
MTAPLNDRTTLNPAWAPGLRATAFAVGIGMMLLVPPPEPARAQEDPVIAKVDGVGIRQSDLNLAEEDIGQNPQQQMMTDDAKHDFLLRYVTDVILAAKAAEAQKIGEQQDFKRRMAFIRNKLLMEMLLQKEGKAALTDQAMHQVYEEAVKQMANQQEVHARHILLPTEAEANAILVELKKGTDFAELAKQKSKDPTAAAQGGDLGYFTKDQMVPEFAEAAFKLDKGQVSAPVKSQFGWHIIKVEDKRNKPVPDFDKVKNQLETFVMRKAQGEYIAKLRAGAKIERMDKN